MKIYIVCFTGNSGLTDYSVSLSRSIAAHFDVVLVTSKALLPRFQNYGFDSHLLFRRSRHYVFDLRRFVRLTLRDRPSCVIFQGPLKVPLVDGIVSVLFRWYGIQTVLTIHDVLPHYPRWWSWLEFRWFYQRFDRLVVHSTVARDSVIKLGVKRPMLVVPHGIYDLFRVEDVSREQARKRIGNFKDEDFIVLFFGHLEPRKGLLEFIEVVKRMQDINDVKFIIAGANDLQKHEPKFSDALNNIKKLSNVLVRDERIPFEEVQNYFIASNVVALPYHEGSTSGVLKLAVAFGIPVVATKVGDFPSEVPPGAGVFIDSGLGLTEQLQAALELIKVQKASFEDAMKCAANTSNWTAIAQAYAEFVTLQDTSGA